jgi:hypothetical protein
LDYNAAHAYRRDNIAAAADVFAVEDLPYLVSRSFWLP